MTVGKKIIAFVKSGNLPPTSTITLPNLVNKSIRAIRPSNIAFAKSAINLSFSLTHSEKLAM